MKWIVWNSSPWSSVCSLGQFKSFHIHEGINLIAIVDWKTNECRIRPRIQSIDIELQKAVIGRRAMGRHACFLSRHIPAGAIYTVYEFYV